MKNQLEGLTIKGSIIIEENVFEDQKQISIELKT